MTKHIRITAYERDDKGRERLLRLFALALLELARQQAAEQPAATKSLAVQEAS